MTPPPPITRLTDLPAQLAAAGYAMLDAAGTAALAGVRPDDLARLAPYWDALLPDQHLRDGGHYRRRRHSCFVVDRQGIVATPHRAHWQPVEYNALHGGIERWFEPIETGMQQAAAFLALLRGLSRLADHLRPGVERWFVEAHPFRIDCTGGIGRPTPEGAHRDGVDLVVVLLVARQQIKGGETRVFDAAGPQGMRFTLEQPWSALLLDDARMIHESTPIQPLHAGATAHRDTFVITFRQDAFQGPGA